MTHTFRKIIALMLSLAVMFGIFAAPVTVNAASNGNKYSKDLEGMINWMTDTKKLTDQQKHDLQKASATIAASKKEKLPQWPAENEKHFSDDRNDRVTDLSDSNDALKLNQMLVAIQNMKRFNEIKHEDDNYANLGMKDNYTNFYFMSLAGTDAMRAAGPERKHSTNNFSCQHFSWGRSDLVDKWYYEEKDLFDDIKSKLGITAITNRKQIKKIEDYAYDNFIFISTYIDQFWSENQVMGVGYTPYSNTICYNEAKKSKYSGFKMYTVDEFEALVKEFCEYVETHDPGDQATSSEDVDIADDTTSGKTDNSSCETTVRRDKAAKTEIVNLPAVKITTPKSAKKSMTVKWNKISKRDLKKIGKIQIQYSTDKSFMTGVKTITAKKTAVSRKINKLRSNKRYYVRVRAYKKTGRVDHVSSWSKVRSIKVK